MQELIKALENNCENIEYYLYKINTLDDQEIVSLFNNENISELIKDKLLVVANERINRLPNKDFISVSNWASSASEYKKYYFNKITTMSYEELIDLIYNGIYDLDILIEVMNTNVYKQYLEQEKKEQKKSDLQCSDIKRRLVEFENDFESLNSIGKEILNLLNTYEKNYNMEMIEDSYLNTIINNIDDIDLESNIIKVGFSIMSLQIKSHKVITDAMIKFYLYVRIKELNLKGVCKNIIVTLGESDEFGHYTLDGDIQKGGTLKIYSEYLKKRFEELKKEFPEECINDVINLYYFLFLSHECAHALKMGKFKYVMDELDAIICFKEIASNKELNYYYRNHILHSHIGEKQYVNNHRTFINEVQADLFAIFDSNRQLITNFKDCFPKNLIENFICTNTDEIVSFYTDQEGNMLSPMEIFDIFYKENKSYFDDTPIVTNENPDIMSSLMLGDKIPLDVYEFIKKIASREILTTDLYRTLTDYIQNRTDGLVDTYCEEQGPTL